MFYPLNKLFPKQLRDEVVKRIRMKPTFFVVGFHKCGTTSLYNYLMQLENCVEGSVKENNTLCYPDFSVADFLRSYPLKKSGKITGCGSHQFTYLPYGIERLAKSFPEAKIIAIMRNPVDRAYSHYRMFRYVSKRDNRELSDALEMELEILKNLHNPEDIEEVFNGTKFFGQAENSKISNGEYVTYGTYLTRGMYYNYLKEFKKYEMDFLPVSLEELNANFNIEFKKVVDYIGIKDDISHVSPAIHNKGHVEKDIMDVKMREFLIEFYKPHNQNLYDLIGKRFDWDK